MNAEIVPATESRPFGEAPSRYRNILSEHEGCSLLSKDRPEPFAYEINMHDILSGTATCPLSQRVRAHQIHGNPKRFSSRILRVEKTEPISLVER